MLRHLAPLVLSGCMLFADFAPEGGAGEGGSPITGGATVSGGDGLGGQGADGSAGGGPAGGGTTTGGSATGGSATGGSATGGNATGGTGGSAGEGGGHPGPLPLTRWVNDGARVIYVGAGDNDHKLVEISGTGIAEIGDLPESACGEPCALDVLTLSGQTYLAVVSGSMLSRKLETDAGWTDVGPARNAAFELGQPDLWYCDSNSNELRNTKGAGEAPGNNICLPGTRIAGITGGALTWRSNVTVASIDDGTISSNSCTDPINIAVFSPPPARDSVAALSTTGGLSLGSAEGDPCPPMNPVTGLSLSWATADFSIGNVNEGGSRPILLLGMDGTLRLCTIESGMTGLQCPADAVIAGGVQVGQFSLWQDETGAGEAVWWDSVEGSVHRRSL